MPQAGPAIVAFVKGVGAAISTATAAIPGGAATLAAGAALSSIAYTSYSTKKAEADARKEGSRAPRDITVRSAVEPARIIYGTARTSGPVVYTNTAPTPGTQDNSTLWTVISLCQHEIEDITEIWLDGDQILSSAIDWAGTGGVTSGKYGPIGSNEVTNFYRRFGTDTQTHVTQLATAFTDWTSDYDGKGVAYIVCAFELGTATGEGVWAQGAPQNIRAVIKGKKVYDPRKDSTQTGGSGAHRLADPTTWEWSDNPALCLADYLFDARLGMGAEGVTYNDIDWDLVFAAANACDVTVTSPDGNQKRFTCNGALSAAETYAENIKQLLSSMSGQITWSGGKYRIRAAAYEAPTYSFTGDDVIGDIQIQPERTRTQRYNKIRGTFIDPDSDYVATQFLPVENTSYRNTRDGGQILTQEIRLPFTNNEYMAQRIAFKQLNLNNQQLRCIVPFNWKALKVAVGDRIQLTIDELSWSNKVFRVDGWQFSPESGFNLELQEDSSSAYADPGLSDYSTRTWGGAISFADQAVSAPSGLTATAEEEAVFLEWEAPPRPSGYDEVVVYASATSAWSGASEIARTRGNTYRHELANGTTRYYWVRAVDVDGRESVRDPDSDTSSITATAGTINTSQLNDDANFAQTADWPYVSDSGGTRPVDNATNNGTTIDTSGNIVGAVATTSSGKLYAGKSTFGSGTGWLLEYNGGTPRFEVGDSSANYVSWNGTSLTVRGTLSADDITAGTLNADRISVDGITSDTNGAGALIIANGGVDTAQLSDNAITLTKFASGLQPVQVVSSLPGGASEGDQAYLTTDNKLYRFDGASWIKAVDGADVSSGTLPATAIVANSITAGQIQAGAINVDELAANAVTADKVNIAQLSSISANLGSITAGTIDASTVTINNLTASNISGDISTFVTFADTSSQTVIEDDGETVIQTFLLPGNSLGLQPIIIATAYFNYNTGMDQDGKLIFRVRQGQNSTTGTVVSTLIIHTRRESGVIESGSINIIGTDSEKTANQYYSITVDVDSGNISDGATFSNVRGVVIGGR